MRLAILPGKPWMGHVNVRFLPKDGAWLVDFDAYAAPLIPGGWEQWCGDRRQMSAESIKALTGVDPRAAPLETPTNKEQHK